MYSFSDQGRKEATERILKVLNKGSISSDNYTSTQQPFFQKDIKQNFDVEFIKNDYEKDIPNELNRNLILIYKIFGNPNKEIYLGEWTIFSLKEAIEQYKDYCQNGQTNVFNFAYKYMGMGHVQVLSCDLKSHLLFFRNDGGSNGYDRLANYNDIIKNGPGKYNKIIFTKWFYNIEFSNSEN